MIHASHRLSAPEPLRGRPERAERQACLACQADRITTYTEEGRVWSVSSDWRLLRPCGERAPDPTVTLKEGRQGPMGYWPVSTRAWPIRHAGGVLALVRIPTPEAGHAD